LTLADTLRRGATLFARAGLSLYSRSARLGTDIGRAGFWNPARPLLSVASAKIGFPPRADPPERVPNVKFDPPEEAIEGFPTAVVA
jgi:hypothetical protein